MLHCAISRLHRKKKPITCFSMNAVTFLETGTVCQVNEANTQLKPTIEKETQIMRYRKIIVPRLHRDMLYEHRFYHLPYVPHLETDRRHR